MSIVVEIGLLIMSLITLENFVISSEVKKIVITMLKTPRTMDVLLSQFPIKPIILSSLSVASSCLVQ